MRVVFVGTSAFAVPSLEALLASRHPVAGVVTQPDRPQGRGRKILPSPVKTAALARGQTLWTPEFADDPVFLDALRAVAPDAIAVASYGQRLMSEFLDLPPHGCINVHPSLVPRYRGASPVPYAILNGDAVTGVSILHMVRRMDAGAVYARREAPVRPDETAGELDARLAPVGAALLVEVLDAIEAGTARAEPQDEMAVVPAPKLTKEEGRIVWAHPAARVAGRIRAMNPWPRALAVLRGAHGGDVRLHLLRAVRAEGTAPVTPGTILDAGREGLVVAAGDGAVRITELQPEGKRPMVARDFINGYRVRPGDLFVQQ